MQSYQTLTTSSFGNPNLKLSFQTVVYPVILCHVQCSRQNFESKGGLGFTQLYKFTNDTYTHLAIMYTLFWGMALFT